MKKSYCLVLLCILIGIAAFSSAAETSDSSKPNIVIILADDLGWNAVGYHNSQISTPNIDKLCQDGIELDNFYASPMCSPTRAGLMTGRYPIRYGMARAVVPPWRNYGLDTTEVTVAEALAKAGYKNRGIFGKWHLGHQQAKWHPENRGFTRFLGCYNGAIDYFTHEREGQLDWHNNGNASHETGYVTTLIGKAAAEFITQSSKDTTPYFCYVPFTAPHSPFQAPQEYLDKFSHIKNEIRRTYFAMIAALDDEVGRIVAAVEDSGQADNTLIWFCSDNGGVGNIKENNKPLHGSKLTAFEGGVRTVACVKFPTKYPGKRKVTEPVAFIDLLPTILDLAKLSPEAAGCKPLDGVNLNPLLSDMASSIPDRTLYFYHGQGGEQDEWSGIKSGRWKLVVRGPNMINGRNDKHNIKLYDIISDPNEKEDLSSSKPDIVNQLFSDFADYRKLQPKNAIPPYDQGRGTYAVPKEWKID